MNMFRILIIFSFMACFVEITSQAQIVTKPYLMSYTQGRVDLNRDTIIYKQEKVIFGLDFKLNEYWSARVGIDLIGMNTPYLKPTVLTFRKNRWTVENGIFATSEMDLSMNRFWNNRFIDRVAADKWISPTADLGVRVTCRWNDFITTDISLASGNGYQKLLDKYYPKPAFRVMLSPVKPIIIGGYIGARKNDVVETTFNSFVHLNMGSKWRATGEYYHKTNSRFVEGNRINVFSTYAMYSLQSWLELMGRYDFVKSNRIESTGESWNVQEDCHAFIGGLIFKLFPTVRMSVNYWNRRPLAKRINNEDWIYVCVEFNY